jgi:hypothetical protein
MVIPPPREGGEAFLTRITDGGQSPLGSRCYRLLILNLPLLDPAFTAACLHSSSPRTPRPPGSRGLHAPLLPV